MYLDKVWWWSYPGLKLRVTFYSKVYPTLSYLTRYNQVKIRDLVLLNQIIHHRHRPTLANHGPRLCQC